jgi:uncharacterized protein (DUF4415 family)
VRYEWDAAKNRINFARHGLDFQDAEQAFAGSCVTLGLLAGRVLVIAHAPCGSATRIISTRKANRREQEIYHKRPPVKKQLTIRLDADVLEWLKAGGRGYQTRINRILRVVMESRPSRLR